MNNLLDKFDEIEIKNDTRLSEPDRLYCESQHELYVKILRHYRDMYDNLQALKEKDEKFYELTAENEYDSGGFKYNIYEHKFVEMNKDDFVKIIKSVHDRFIEQIKSHFRKKYNISLSVKEFEKYMNAEKPKGPERYWYGSMSDEEKTKYLQKMKKYSVECNSYLDNIINIELHYDCIVDDIFFTLGGYTFMEKVDQEIKDGVVKTITGHKSSKYTLKNSKISFDILFSHKSAIWDEYKVSLNSDGYRALLRALTYFDSDKSHTSVYRDWDNRFIAYDKKESDGIYDTHQTYKTKITHFKYYKNGKLEVMFDSHTSALQFASEYLGYTENKESNDK